MNRKLLKELTEILRASSLPDVDDDEFTPDAVSVAFAEMWSSNPATPINTAWGMAQVLTAIDLHLPPTAR